MISGLSSLDSSFSPPLPNWLRLAFSSSPFYSDRLAQVKSPCQELNQHLGRLLYLSASLPEKLQLRLARQTGLDHQNIGDVMAIQGVVEQALKAGDPLPEVLRDNSPKDASNTGVRTRAKSRRARN